MRKSLWIILTVLFVAIGAPRAHADTLYIYTYSFSGDPDQLTFTTDPIAAVTGQTIIYAADLASYSLTGSFWSGASLDYVVLDFGNNPGNQDIVSTGSQFLSAGFGLTLADYSTPGTYSNYGGLFGPGFNTLVVTAVQTPEPSTGILMLVGVGFGFLLVMLKRFA